MVDFVFQLPFFLYSLIHDIRKFYIISYHHLYHDIIHIHLYRTSLISSRIEWSLPQLHSSNHAQVIIWLAPQVDRATIVALGFKGLNIGG